MLLMNFFANGTGPIQSNSLDKIEKLALLVHSQEELRGLLRYLLVQEDHQHKRKRTKSTLLIIREEQILGRNLIESWRKDKKKSQIF